MNENELPSICPFCQNDHTVDLLRIQINAAVTCPKCKKKYIIPYSEIKSMLQFQQNLENMISDPNSDKNDIKNS